MSWKRFTLICRLSLVFLLVGHLRSRIFVDANAIDCTYGWSAPTFVNGNLVRKAFCYKFKDNGQDFTTYACGYCKRSDKLIPSARNCVDSDGKVMNSGEAWACDQGITVYGDSRSDGRQILCEHTDTDGTVGSYNCKNRNVFQQCAKDSCG
ncbi:uncharacterized protein MELLADRAFT_123544 [Melampsora larici-populina 98AG31]|uniref:Secreted protein n=1 Tax=Melampsora larici-populina (strain 98AG31 / pathotype 3-4-7) TaxID=747676 RepID=F4SD94_MELLP|nr:uncharacterized protein MELLADRAFT_123544 [Melampsora larici-populina 98AG31]EGF97380.1 secreted protein [Melampsora larici-populina 98AG31]